MTPPDRDRLIELAQRADAICATGGYVDHTAARVDLSSLLATSLVGTALISPAGWPDIELAALACCQHGQRLAGVQVTHESTLAAVQRLVVVESLPEVAALNFASARNPGGGYRNGAMAQEETIARSSGLVCTLERCWNYYDQNRKQESLLYTDHAIWSPQVPFFATDDGTLLSKPYVAGVITMPAPNAGAMRAEADLLGVVPTFRRRIRWVLALAVAKGVRHLVLGAWGCGAFGNHADLVARLFREALDPAQPWRRGLDSVTFAIIDTSKRRAALGAFTETLADLATGEQI